jgi:peptidoglycan/LPS O-acetylase OafA/YrhL
MPSHPESVHLTPPKRHRFILLDGLRGFAALFVVAFHLPPQILRIRPANGLLAVDFFFALSGFVIAFSYQGRLEQALSFREFVVARWIRLYPVYLIGSAVGLLTSVLLASALGGPRERLLNWVGITLLAIFLWPVKLSTLHGPYAQYMYPLNGPAWSLFYEVVANVAFAALVKIRAARTATFLVIVLLSGAVLGISVLHQGTIDVGNTNATFALGFARVALSFSIGVIVQRVYRTRKPSAGSVRTLIAVVSLLAIILLSPMALMQTEVFRLVAVLVCFPVLLYFGAISEIPHHLASPCIALGELSYPLYLVHMPLVGILYARRVLHVSALYPKLSTVSGLLLIAVLAVTSWWLSEHYDVPVRRALIDRWNSRATVSAK